MLSKRGVHAEVDVVFVEIIVAILHEQAVEPTSFGIQFIDAIRLSLLRIPPYRWFIVKAIENVMQRIVLNIK